MRTELRSTDLIVDIHSHFYPRSFAEYLRKRDLPPYVRPDGADERFKLFNGDLGVEFSEDFQDLSAKLAFMDRSGIDQSVISVGNPWLDLDAGEATVSLAMRINDDLLDSVDQERSRLAALCVLPNDTPQAAADVIRDVGSDGRCAGFVVGTEICGRPFDDAELEPVWRAVTDRGLTLFVHPREGLAGRAAQGYGQVLTIALDFPFATTVALARLIMSGVTLRHPRLKVVAAHGGGTLPYLFGRIERAARVDTAGLGHRVEDLLASARESLYVDAVLYSADSLRLAVDVMGPANVMFGSDHPFPIEDAVGELKTISSLADTGGNHLQQVLGDNARSLFGLKPR
jgi:predicted TIM-barrel fold metal-dependent hydrolase